MPSIQPTHYGYAVNVKDYETFPRETGMMTDNDVDALYHEYQEEFWHYVSKITAPEHGFQTVYSEGRMGGWCVPLPQPEENKIEDKFRPFERDVIAVMDDYRAQFLEELEHAVERANAEPAEVAYWAASDVVTEV